MPGGHLLSFLDKESKQRNQAKIITFKRKAGRWPGILAGQRTLQKLTCPYYMYGCQLREYLYNQLLIHMLFTKCEYDKRLISDRCGVGVDQEALKIFDVIKRSENYIV